MQDTQGGFGFGSTCRSTRINAGTQKRLSTKPLQARRFVLVTSLFVDSTCCLQVAVTVGSATVHAGQ
jgi:hypothetical protein